jgi:phage shock protein C
MTNQATLSRPLRRSRKNRVLFGVCGGLAEFFGIDVFWFRLLVLIAALPGGLPIWPYLLLVLVIPSE